MQGENAKKANFDDGISRKLDYLFKYSLDWIFFLDTQGVILDTNDRVVDFIGIERDQIIGKDISFLQEGIEYIDGIGNEEAGWRDNVNAREYKVKYRLNTYRQSVAHIVDEGELQGYIITISDITDKKSLELAQAQHYQTTRALLNSTIQSAVLVDAEGYIVEINNVLLKEVGKTYGEMIGKKIRVLIPDELKGFPNIYEKTVEAKQPILKEFEYKGKWYRLISYPVLDDKDTVYRVAMFTEDITERKNIEQQLLEYQNHLENLVKERTVELEEMNSALNVLLKGREKDKEALEQKIIFNLKELVFPAIEKIKTSTKKDERVVNLLDVIQQNLNEIVSPFSQKLSSRYFNFTPTELNIANQIKHGKTTKEIAETLYMAYNTVEFHRANIRKKLEISNKKVNLRTHLQFISE